MNNKTCGEDINPTSQYKSSTLTSIASDAAVSRRKLLLRGIAKGSVVAAGSVSIKSFASTSSVTANGKICSVSGTQSAAHSQATGLPTCGGLSPGYYKMLVHWPNYNGSASPPVATNSVGSKTFTQNTPFNSIFGGGSAKSLIDILKNDASSLEFHWIPALLNAIRPPAGYVFPYSPKEVLDLYKGVGATSSDALMFFKRYMETI